MTMLFIVLADCGKIGRDITEVTQSSDNKMSQSLCHLLIMRVRRFLVVQMFYIIIIIQSVFVHWKHQHKTIRRSQIISNNSTSLVAENYNWQHWFRILSQQRLHYTSDPLSATPPIVILVLQGFWMSVSLFAYCHWRQTSWIRKCTCKKQWIFITITIMKET